MRRLSDVSRRREDRAVDPTDVAGRRRVVHGVRRSVADRSRRTRALFVINIDHHLGNKMYGAVNWFDESAAACGEMVFDVIEALGVRWTPEIAAHLYLAI